VLLKWFLRGILCFLLVESRIPLLQQRTTMSSSKRSIANHNQQFQSKTLALKSSKPPVPRVRQLSLRVLRPNRKPLCNPCETVSPGWKSEFSGREFWRSYFLYLDYWALSAQPFSWSLVSLLGWTPFVRCFHSGAF